MERRFLDTNPIIRYLTQDQPVQAAASRALFAEAESGDLSLVASESVIVEVVRVLSSRVLYALSREEVRRHVRNVLALPGVSVPNKRTLLRALDIWVEHSVDFVDALSVAQMERLGIRTIATFDRDFDRLGVTRREPGT